MTLTSQARTEWSAVQEGIVNAGSGLRCAPSGYGHSQPQSAIRDGALGGAAPLRRRALAVVAAGLGNAGQRHFARMAILADGEVAERDNADKALLAVQHRQPPDLLIGHVLRDIVDIVVLEAVSDLFAHYVPDRGVGAEAVGNPSDCNVTVRDHSHQTVIVADRQHADIVLLHFGRHLAQLLRWTGDVDAPSHDVSDSHRGSPSLKDTVAVATACRRGRFPRWNAGATNFHGEGKRSGEVVLLPHGERLARSALPASNPGGRTSAAEP